MRDSLRNFLVAFWLFLAGYYFLRAGPLLFAACVCLVLYWVLAIRRQNRMMSNLKEIQNLAGLSDKAMSGLLDAGENRKERPQIESPAKEQEADLRAQANSRPVEIVVSLDEKRSFPAETEGSLCINPGPVETKIEMEPFDYGEGIVWVRCKTFVCDSEGREWMAESIAPTDAWLENLAAPEEAAFTKWASAPPTWLKAMKENCAAAELTDLRDSREYHELTLDGATYPFFEKYQMPIVDIAWLSEEKLWLVRARRIQREWRDDPPGFEGEEEIPPFAWTVPPSTGSLLLGPDQHVVNGDDVFEEPENRVEKVTFRATGRTGRPQPTVTTAKEN